jgi:hypothetical protein
MKGVVFNLLEGAVTRGLGDDMWDTLLDAAGVGGAYTSLGNYPDSDMEALVAAAGQALDLNRDQVLRWFGQSAIPILAEIYPDFFTAAPNARAFVEGINSQIHTEVRKLYPGALCPHFNMRSNSSGDLVMDYISRRNMCALAQGFVEGTAVWYGETVTFEHVTCTSHGAPHCTFAVTWSPATPETAKAA